ncbi:MAG: hypothetical protein NTV22_08420 [bacterium]|nr:hypothetical protein [bacterium]
MKLSRWAGYGAGNEQRFETANCKPKTENRKLPAMTLSCYYMRNLLWFLTRRCAKLLQLARRLRRAPILDNITTVTPPGATA